jgi:hypothetical protein
MKKITLFIGLLLFLLACTTSKDISADSEIVEDSSSIIPLVHEEAQLNPPAISHDAAGQQVIQSTDERWDTMGIWSNER